MLEPRLKVTQDIVFHYLFSSPGAEDGLLGFVNAVQESVGKPLAKNVTIQSPFNLQNYVGDKQTVLDVRATDSENREYDVEIQVCDQDYFLERTLYYWARMYSSALTSGEDYEKLHPVVAIILTKFEVCAELYDLHNEFCISAKKNPSVILTDHFQYHLLEMTQKRWNRHLELFSTDSKSNEILRQKSLFNWIKFILHADTQTEDEMTKLIEMTPGLGTAYNKYQEFNSDPTMREYALAREKTDRDHLGQLNTAHRRGYAEGEFVGLERGRAEGRAEGEAIGLEKGEAIGLEKGEAIGLEKGEAIGAIKAKHQFLISCMTRFYADQFTEADRGRILQISDSQKLDEILQTSMDRPPYSELVKMF